jgi:hypothetical protein
MPGKHRDARFGADAQMLIQSLRALGGPKPAKRAPSKPAAKASMAGSKVSSR